MEREGKNCVIEYHFSNPSLGPVYGERSFRVYTRDDVPTKIVDTQRGSVADRKLGFPGLDAVLDVLKGRTQKYRVTMDQGRIRSIEPRKSEGKTGGFFHIDIRSISCR